MNELIWSRSIQKPPRRIKVKLKKADEKKVKVMLPEEKEEKKTEKKKEEQKEEETAPKE